MAKIYEVFNKKLSFIKEYSDLNISTDGLIRYFSELGYSRGEVEDILGEGYWDGNYDKFIVDFKGKRIIAED